jgi:hypothetical protein
LSRPSRLRRAFREWWLQEAIPQAWALTEPPARSDAPTMLFERTMRTTAYRTGIAVSFDIDSQDNLTE